MGSRRLPHSMPKHDFEVCSECFMHNRDAHAPIEQSYQATCQATLGILAGYGASLFGIELDDWMVEKRGGGGESLESFREAQW